MDFAWVDAFLAVADTGSFSLAAEALFLSQSVVSKQVQRLEKSLGIPLFDRSHRRAVLTMEGRRVYPEAKALTDQYRRLVQAACSGDMLRLVLSPVADSYGFTQLLSEFSVKYPDISIQVEERNNVAAHSMVQTDRCDGAFYRIPPNRPLPPEHILLLREELVLLVPADAAPEQGARLPLSRFTREKFLLPDSGTGLYDAAIELFRQEGITPEIRYIGSSGQNIARMVREGMGIALLAEQVARKLLDGQLQIVQLQPTCESCLVFAPSIAGSQKVSMAALRNLLKP